MITWVSIKSKFPEINKWRHHFNYFDRRNVNEGQCDQMVKLFLQYLAIYSIESLLNSIKNCQSSFKNLPNTKSTLQKHAQNLKNSKITQIWSHWFRGNKEQLFFFSQNIEKPFIYVSRNKLRMDCSEWMNLSTVTFKGRQAGRQAGRLRGTEDAVIE